jgi:hypothetical protein
MSKVRIIFILSIFVAILPFLGFPYSFKNILYSATGLALMYLTFSAYYKNPKEKKAETFENFSENVNFTEKEEA